MITTILNLFRKQRYAIVIKPNCSPIFPSAFVLVNSGRPYFVPKGKERQAYNALSAKRSPTEMVVIADKYTLLHNPFDLCEVDFETPLSISELLC
jgi:hypothetical protein